MSNGWPSNQPEITAEERDELITKWINAKNHASQAIEVERALRENCVNRFFPSPDKGTNRYQLPQNYSLKMVYSYSYTLGDKDLLDAENKKVSINTQVEYLQQELERINEGFAKKFIRWKPELIASEYESIDTNIQVEAQAKALIDNYITVKPAMPQLSLEEPKAK